MNIDKYNILLNNVMSYSNILALKYDDIILLQNDSSVEEFRFLAIIWLKGVCSVSTTISATISATISTTISTTISATISNIYYYIYYNIYHYHYHYHYYYYYS